MDQRLQGSVNLLPGSGLPDEERVPVIHEHGPPSQGRDDHLVLNVIGWFNAAANADAYMASVLSG
jgi:hypothetical protein